jgi:hypothetical protein
MRNGRGLKARRPGLDMMIGILKICRRLPDNDIRMSRQTFNIPEATCRLSTGYNQELQMVSGTIITIVSFAELRNTVEGIL